MYTMSRNNKREPVPLALRLCEQCRTEVALKDWQRLKRLIPENVEGVYDSQRGFVLPPKHS